MSNKRWTTARTGPVVIVVLSASVATGCGDVNRALQQVSEARRLSADTLVQFTKAVDAANRAVMADTDDASVAFARQAEQAKQAIRKDTGELRPILQSLGYADEMQLLDEFGRRFASYEALDHTILDLAVENTNLKAQRLSFGPAQEAANAFREALAAVAPLDERKEGWHAKALVATALASVREIQVLQAPHIADPDDAVMTRIEKQMLTSEADARSALASLVPIAQPASRPRLAAATAALDRFMSVNAQIVALSRRNTNVRSLALSLNQKAPLIKACEDSLTRLQEALQKRGFTDRRYIR
jgi:hypothetical protein